MIKLHRLAHTPEPFHVNPGLVCLVEAAPDTHVSLSTGTKLVVTETVDEVIESIRAWHVDIATSALELAR